MYKFLQKHNLPKLTQKETGNLNNPIIIKEFNPKLKRLLTKKTPRLDSVLGEWLQNI